MRNSTLGVSVAVWMLFLVATGCGTLDMDFITEVSGSGVVTQKLAFEGTDQLGSLIINTDTAEGLRDDGWDVQLDRAAELSRLSASKVFERAQDITLPEVGSEEDEGATLSISDFMFEVESRGLYRYYSFALAIPQSENLAESTRSSDDEFEEMGEAMAQLLVQSIPLSWGIRLPGNIIETNADSTSGNLATWEFDLMSLEEGRTLRVESRELNKVVVVLFISAGAAILLLLGILVVLMAHRRKASRVPAG